MNKQSIIKESHYSRFYTEATVLQLYLSMRWCWITFVLLLGCETPSSLTPYTDLPFEYVVSLEAESSTCLQPGLTVQQDLYKGEMIVGSQEEMTVATIDTDSIFWRFEGLLCRNDKQQATGLCLGLRQSITKLNLERAPGIRQTDNGLLSCVEWTTAPADVAAISTHYHLQSSEEREILLPQSAAWLEELQLCCMDVESNQAIKLEISSDSQLKGTLSLRHELVVETPTNKSPAMLSSTEYFGALALCGGPQNCVERFQLTAKPQ